MTRENIVVQHSCQNGLPANIGWIWRQLREVLLTPGPHSLLVGKIKQQFPFDSTDSPQQRVIMSRTADRSLAAIDIIVRIPIYFIGKSLAAGCVGGGSQRFENGMLIDSPEPVFGI